MTYYEEPLVVPRLTLFRTAVTIVVAILLSEIACTAGINATFLSGG